MPVTQQANADGASHDSATQTHQPLTIMQLPVDVIRLISQACAPVGRACLALTSSAMYKCISDYDGTIDLRSWPVCRRALSTFKAPSYVPVTEHAPADLNRLFNRNALCKHLESTDHALADKQYHCSLCVKLHPYDKSWACNQFTDWPSHDPLLQVHSLRFGPYGTDTIIGYDQARLAMRASQGYPGLSIGDNFSPKIPTQVRGNIEVNQAMDARIVGDEFLVRCEYTLTAVDGVALRPVAFMLQVKGLKMGLCPHWCVGGPFGERIPILDKKFKPRKEWGMCGFCSMDLKVQTGTVRGTGMRRCQIKMITWQALGDCSSQWYGEFSNSLHTGYAVRDSRRKYHPWIRKVWCADDPDGPGLLWRLVERVRSLKGSR